METHRQPGNYSLSTFKGGGHSRYEAGAVLWRWRWWWWWWGGGGGRGCRKLRVETKPGARFKCAPGRRGGQRGGGRILHGSRSPLQDVGTWRKWNQNHTQGAEMRRNLLTPGHAGSRSGFRMWLDSRLLPCLFQKTIGWDYSNSDGHTQIRAGDMQSPAMRILLSREWKRHTWDQLSPLLPPPPPPSSPPSLSRSSTLYLGPQGGAEPAAVT